MAMRSRRRGRTGSPPGQSFLDRFHPRTRAVVNTAEDIARELGHGPLGTGHLLLAVHDIGPEPAADVLHRAGASRHALHSVLDAPDPPVAPDAGGPRYTRGVAEALHTAIAIALGRAEQAITPEHLVIAAIRQPDGAARRMLERLALDVDELDAALRRMLAGAPEPDAQLHRWHISPREYARHEQRRGRRHSIEDLDARRTALVVVDMVPFFLDENPYARGIVDHVNALASTLRDLGGTVAWVLPGRTEPTPAMVEHFGSDVAERYRTSGGDGPLIERLAPTLDARPDDVLVEKTAASAFFPGRCDLHDILQACSIDTVLVTGTVANVCCESTTRDAGTLGYRTVMVADANAAARDRDLNATLHTIYRSFGDVRPTAELIDLLRTDAPERPEV